MRVGVGGRQEAEVKPSGVQTPRKGGKVAEQKLGLE